MIYVFVLIYILFCIYYFDYKKRTSIWSYRLLCIIFILISGLSYRLGCDVIRYQNWFESNFDIPFTMTAFLRSENIGGHAQEPLWLMLNWFFYNIFGEWWIFKIVVAAFVNITIFTFIKRNSTAPYLSIFLYALMYYCEINYQTIRESIAVALFLIGLEFIIKEDKKYWKYYSLILIASLFHRFACVGLIFPFLLKIKYDKRVFILVLLIIITIPYVETIINNFLNIGILNTLLSERVNDLMVSDIYGKNYRNFMGIIEMMVLTILPIMLLLKNNDDSPMLSLALVFVAITVFRMTSLTIAYRINNYLFFPFSIALTSAINNSVFIRNYKKQNFKLGKNYIISVFCVLLYLGGIIRDVITSPDTVMYYPYSSIISKKIDSSREAYYANMYLNW